VDEAPSRKTPRRYRAYQIAGIAIGVLFLGLAAAAYFGGGGPLIAVIAAVGGILCIVASIVTWVRNR
jgi:uncharacterized membrane protein